MWPIVANHPHTFGDALAQLAGWVLVFKR
jgi:hypothetical protein